MPYSIFIGLSVQVMENFQKNQINVFTETPAELVFWDGNNFPTRIHSAEFVLQAIKEKEDAIEKGKYPTSNQPEHQDGVGSGEEKEASNSNSPEHGEKE